MESNKIKELESLMKLPHTEKNKELIIAVANKYYNEGKISLDQMISYMNPYDVDNKKDVADTNKSSNNSLNDIFSAETVANEDTSQKNEASLGDLFSTGNLAKEDLITKDSSTIFSDDSSWIGNDQLKEEPKPEKSVSDTFNSDAEIESKESENKELEILDHLRNTGKILKSDYSDSNLNLLEESVNKLISLGRFTEIEGDRYISVYKKKKKDSKTFNIPPIPTLKQDASSEQSKKISIDDVDVDVDMSIFMVDQKPEIDKKVETSIEEQNVSQAIPNEDSIVEVAEEISDENSEKDSQKSLDMKEQEGVREKHILADAESFSQYVATRGSKEKVVKNISRIEAMDNFEFLKNQAEDYYSSVKGIEEASRIDYKKAGTLVRDLLEDILKDLAKQNKVGQKTFEEYIKDNRNRLGDKATWWSPDTKIKYFLDKGILPKSKDISYINFKGKEYRKNPYHFLRLVGNSCSHQPGKNNGEWPARSFETIVLALRVLHKHFSRLYEGAKKFDENAIMIRDYSVISYGEPLDSGRSNCVMEYIGYREGDTPRHYAIIRQYDTDKMDDTFILRNVKTYNEAIESNDDGEDVSGMAHIEEISTFTDELPDYFVAYTFSRYPELLTDETLTTIMESTTQSSDILLNICKKIARCFKVLHGLEQPIYHRMLTYESIALCNRMDRGQGWAPSVINFDFTKFENNDEQGTVIDQWRHKMSVIGESEEFKLMKYFPTKDSFDTPWEKQDVYSMGILFGDILRGKIGETKCDTLFDLESYSEEVRRLIDKMTSVNPLERPSANDVYEVLKAETK